MKRSLFLTCTFLTTHVATMMSTAARPTPETTNTSTGTSEACCAVQASAESASLLPSHIRIKILLVEFEDVRCTKGADGRTPLYAARNFENLLGSDGIYVSPHMFSPDGEEVYGSMNDYFKAMSGGRMRLSASVVNPRDPESGAPLWIRLSRTKGSYQEQRYFDCLFFQDAMQAARDSGLDISTPTDTRLVIIYAGNLYLSGGGLNPNAGERVYIMSEVQGMPYGQEVGTATFSRIGIHCHEFAHTLGVGHASGSRADLMDSGTRNGSVAGNAPAPLNAIARVSLRWAQMIEIGAADTGEVELEYSLTSPKVYRMKNARGDDFFIENRRFDCMMRIGTVEVPDYNHAAFFPPAWPHHQITQGILVWRMNTNCDWRDPGYSRIGLLYASGQYGRTYPENTPSETDDGVPFPGVCGVKILSPWSDPRNPYMRETDYFDSSRSHYTLHVPNTKGGTLGGFEIVSENAVQGTFRVIFRVAHPANPAANNLSTVSTAAAHNSQRKLFREPGGRLHMVFESGGEIFYRLSLSGGQTWESVRQVSNGNGGNAAPNIAVFGQTVMIVWQVQASGEMCYAIHSTRSADGGLIWSPVASLGLVTGCTDPGPIPTAAGSWNGHALVLYRGGRGVSGTTSTDAGVTWKAIPPFPGSTESWGPPACAMTRSGGGSLLAHVAAADNAPAGGSGIHYNAFDVQTGTWTGGTVLSNVLPPECGDSRNPCIAAADRDSAGSTALHVVWEALDFSSGSKGVIVHRTAEDGGFSPAYSLIANGSLSSPSVTSTGGDSALLLCQRDPEHDLWRLHYDGQTWRGDSHAYATMGTDPQASTGAGAAVSMWTAIDRAPFQINVRAEDPFRAQTSSCWRYARSLSISDPKRLAALQVSLGSCATVRRDGMPSELSLCACGGRDTMCSAGALAGLLRTQPFRLDGRADSIQVEFRISGQAREGLFTSGLGSVAFQLVRQHTGEVLGTFARHCASDIAEECEGVTRLVVPLAAVSPRAGDDSCVIRLVVDGFCGKGVTASLGHVYSRGCCRPISGCPGSFEEYPTSVPDPGTVPQAIVLHQNYPNPFNAQTTIRYELPLDASVRMEVYSTLGQLVCTPVDGVMKQGRYEAIFDGSGLASGAYFCRLSVQTEGSSLREHGPGPTHTVAQTKLILLK